MRVGIISKEEHAKSHVAALLREGYEPVVLGGSPTGVPDSIDVLVCRVVSCSHGATDVAQKVRREGRMPVVFENGVEGILEALHQIENGTFNGEGEESMARSPNTSVASEIDRVVQIARIFHPKMLTYPVHQMADFLVSLGLMTKESKPQFLLALQMLAKRDYNSVRRYMREYQGELMLRTMYYPHAKSSLPVHEYFLVSSNVPEATLDKYFKRFEFAHKDVIEAKNAPPVTHRPKAKVEAPKVEAPKVEAKVEVDAPKVEAPKVEPARAVEVKAEPVLEVKAEIKAEAEVPKPASAPELVQALARTDPMDDVKAALALLREAMVKLNFKRMSLTQEGVVEFERVVVQTGTFSL